jgi:hypothetical protein
MKTQLQEFTRLYPEVDLSARVDAERQKREARNLYLMRNADYMHPCRAERRAQRIANNFICAVLIIIALLTILAVH